MEGKGGYHDMPDQAGFGFNHKSFWMNIRSFGAAGDGVQDDTGAIQKAIDDIDDRGGGVLFFPPGRYRIYSSIIKSLKNAISIVGAAGSIIDGRESKDPVLIRLTGFREEDYTLEKDAQQGDYVLRSRQVLTTGLYLITSKDLWNPARAYYYKGEMVELESVKGSQVTLKAPLFDSYASNTTTLHRMHAPKIVVSDMEILRDSNHAGLLIEYAQDIELRNVSVKGARERGIQVRYVYGGVVDHCSVTDCWYKGSGTSYGLAIISSQYLDVIGGRYIGGRHGITHGGQEPVRCIIHSGVTAGSHSASGQAAFDIHGNGELITLKDSTIFNGVDLCGGNLRVIHNTIYESNVGFGVRWFGEIGSDYLDISGNHIETWSPGSSAIVVNPTQPSIQIQQLTINGNSCKGKKSALLVKPQNASAKGFYIHTLEMLNNHMCSEQETLKIERSSDAGVNVKRLVINAGSFQSRRRAAVDLEPDEDSRIHASGALFVSNGAGHACIRIKGAKDVLFSECVIEGLYTISAFTPFSNTGILKLVDNIVENTRLDKEHICGDLKPSLVIMNGNIVRRDGKCAVYS